MDGPKETRDRANELEGLIEQLNDLSLTLPEVTRIRSRIFELLGWPRSEHDR